MPVFAVMVSAPVTPPVLIPEFGAISTSTLNVVGEAEDGGTLDDEDEAAPLDDTASRGSADDGTKPLVGKATRESVNDEAAPFATGARGLANEGVVPGPTAEEASATGG